MLVTKFIEIDCGHRIPNHKSKCRNLHGHRYKIVVAVDDKIVTEKGGSDEGMVIDFSDIKQLMMRHIDVLYDHGFIIYEHDELIESFKQWFLTGMKIIVVPFIPTAENLAKHWFVIMKDALLQRKIKIEYVEVYETPTSTAKYTRTDYESDTNR